MFFYDPTLNDDISLVRFHIGDTDKDGHFLDDEAISYWIEQHGVNKTVIIAIRHILSLMSRPDFRLDWMSVSGMKDAREGYKDLLRAKQRELDVSDVLAVGTISNPYRADSLQDSEGYPYDS